MLRETGRRINDVALIQASAGGLPFASSKFDAVVSAYVLRNLQQGGLLAESLAEFHRVLAPGGKLVFLDLTRPRFAPLRWGHWIYLKTALPAIGRACFGARWPGAYLRRSIADLPSEDRLRSLWLSAGFRGFNIRPLWGGVVSLFIGSK
jgi:demethylmenaquinone methyltransferase/2-methoxy-6-polyprenyl-1,4-benzoquinol methylase